MIIFQEDRKKSIESLEFFFFLHDLYFSLLEKNETENRLIKEFLDVIGTYRYWESYKIQNYTTSLRDHVFWRHSDFYLKTMRKFVSQELTGEEFKNQFYSTLLRDMKDDRILKMDFKRQAKLELNPKIYQFGKIIENFDLPLQAFDPDPEPGDLTEDQLREIVKNVLPRVEQYFVEEI